MGYLYKNMKSSNGHLAWDAYILYSQHQVIASGIWLHVFGSHLEDLDQLRLDTDLATSKEYQEFNVSKS